MLLKFYHNLANRKTYYIFLNNIKSASLNKKAVGMILPTQDKLYLMYVANDKCVYFEKSPNNFIKFNLFVLPKKYKHDSIFIKLVNESKQHGQLLSNHHVVEYFFEQIISQKNKYQLNTEEIRLIFNLIMQIERSFFSEDSNLISFADNQNWVD